MCYVKFISTKCLALFNIEINICYLTDKQQIKAQVYLFESKFKNNRSITNIFILEQWEK